MIFALLASIVSHKRRGSGVFEPKHEIHQQFGEVWCGYAEQASGADGVKIAVLRKSSAKFENYLGRCSPAALAPAFSFNKIHS
jgi:hypothetical protein